MVAAGFLSGVYGAFFGGGLGVLLLAFLSLFVSDDLQRLNALKGVLSLIINFVAALYFISFSTFLCKPGLYLEDLFVEPAHRGKGFGKALLRHLAGICVDRGYGRFEWRVLDWNEPSIKFYESLGAKVLPEWELVRMVEAEFRALAAN